MDKDKAYILHIRDAIEAIERYTENIDFKMLENDVMRQDAIVREFEILGEAAKNVSAKMRNAYNEVPWQKMSDMRNKLTHEYFDVDLDVVWKTIRDDLPELKKQIQKIIKESQYS